MSHLPANSTFFTMIRVIAPTGKMFTDGTDIGRHVFFTFTKLDKCLRQSGKITGTKYMKKTSKGIKYQVRGIIFEVRTYFLFVVAVPTEPRGQTTNTMRIIGNFHFAPTLCFKARLSAKLIRKLLF